MGKKSQAQRRGKGRGKSGSNSTATADPKPSTSPASADAPSGSAEKAESGQEVAAVAGNVATSSCGYKAGAEPAAAASSSTPLDPAFLETAEDLKQQGNELYVKDDAAGAITKYGLAIEAFEAAAGDSPQAHEHRKILAVLYSNRAQAALALVRQAQPKGGWKPGMLSSLPKELRMHGFRANADASQAVELDEQNAKAWLRRGQALLVMSLMQQRAKEAVECFKRARACGLPASLQTEAAQHQKYAQALFDQETDMPENCSIL